MNMPNPEKLADNTTLQVIARLSMIVTPFLLSGFVYVGSGWLGEKFKEVEKLTEAAPIMRENIRVLQADQEDQERFQNQTSVKLDQITAILTTILQEQAALRANLENQQRQIDRRR